MNDATMTASNKSTLKASGFVFFLHFFYGHSDLYNVYRLSFIPVLMIRVIFNIGLSGYAIVYA